VTGADTVPRGRAGGLPAARVSEGGETMTEPAGSMAIRTACRRGLTPLLLTFAFAMIPGLLQAQDTPGCLGSIITFDTSALEKIVREPRQVLDNADAFWRDEKAQVYTMMWAKDVNYDLSRDAWRRALEKLAALRPDEREAHPLLKVAEAIIARRDEFLAAALPRVCAYFPADARMDVPIYFTAYIPPRSFAKVGIVVNVAAAYWKANPDNILNSLVHELGHVGYSRCRERRGEKPLHPEAMYRMLESLQNEGICTYIGHEAVPAFPAPDEADYRLLESPDDVTRLLRKVNGLLAQVGRLDSGELARRSWREGVTNRAYYIAGAHMSGVIDTRLGRAALVGSLTEGPAAFASLYNSLVEQDRRIIVPDAETVRAREAAAARAAWLRTIAGLLATLCAGVILGVWLRRRHRRSRNGR
jgi:hypothetical protein